MRCSRPLRVAVLVLTVSTAGCATMSMMGGIEYIAVAPPPARVDAMPMWPGPSFVWVAGHWRWEPGGWAWVGGYWSPRRAGQSWVPGRWRHHKRHGWYWTEGHWR